MRIGEEGGGGQASVAPAAGEDGTKTLAIAMAAAATAGGPAAENLPKFLAPLGNHTVIQGRDVTFTCIVNHLKDYRVAWIKSDSRAILAIHTHLVAHNPRISVTHNGHNTWKLHLSNVQKNDSGTYMCQVNTEPMLSQVIHYCYCYCYYYHHHHFGHQ